MVLGIARNSLEHGATVVVDSGGSAPVSAIYLWLPVGTAAEPPGLEGAAHFLEHLLFKGAGDHGVGEAARLVESLGGDLNAFTAYEQTVLHATVPAGGEAQVVQLLAEMARRPRLDPVELEREKDVVIEEIRGAADAADQILMEAVRARLYGDHPYGRPILGTEASVRGLDRGALAAFHQANYGVDRAVLAVAGPVEPAEVLDWARRWLVEDQPRPRPGATPAFAGGGGEGARRVFCQDAGFDERLVELAFPVPALNHPDIAALDLLFTALGDGDSALLPRVLKNERALASDTWSALEPEPAGGMAVAGLAAREGGAVEAVEALTELLAQVAREGLGPAALHRARVKALGARMHDRETADGRAHRLAWYEAFFADPNAESAYEAALLRVTPADLRRVAARWLAPEAAVVGAVAPRRALGAARLGTAVGRGFGRGARVAPARSTALVQRRLPCGATVVVAPDPEAELAAVSVVGVGGALAEGPDNGGLADLWAAVVGRGAGDRDASAFAEAIEDRGGRLSPWSWRNSSGISGSFPAGDLDFGLGLLLDVLRRPRFDAEEVALAREEALESLAAVEDAPAELAEDLAWGALFRGHPWGRPAAGTAGGLRRATRARVSAFHQRVMCGANLVIALAGAVDPDRVFADLAAGLRDLPEGEAVLPAPPVVPARLARARRRVLARQQAQLVLAFPGVGWGSADAPAQSILEGVLGGQGGRLFGELREARGLAYDVGLTAEEGLGGGAILCSMATDPARVKEATAALWQVLEDFAASPVSDQELARARARVVNGAALGLQRAEARASQLAAAERYGPGADQLEALIAAPGRVSAAALQRFARATLQRGRHVLVHVGPR